MDRKNFHFNPDTAAYEEKAVYLYLNRFDFKAEVGSASSAIIPDDLPRLICEEALYQMSNFKLTEIKSDKITDDLLYVFDADELLSSPSSDVLRSEIINLRNQTSFLLLTAHLSYFVLLAICMILLQKEILSKEESNFIEERLCRFSVHEENIQVFHSFNDWLKDALSQNPRENKYTSEYIDILYFRSDNVIPLEIQKLLLHGIRRLPSFNSAVPMYYTSSLLSLYKRLSRLYHLDDVDIVASAFDDALSYNFQTYDSSFLPNETSIKERLVGQKDESKYEEKIGTLFSNYDSLYTKSIRRDREFIRLFGLIYLNDKVEMFENLKCVDLITLIHDTYNAILKKRKIMQKPVDTDMIKCSTKNTSISDDTAFFEMLKYIEKCKNDSAVEAIITMLTRIYRRDDEKYALIEQAEQRHIEESRTLQNINLSAGSSLNLIEKNQTVNLHE